ncbi:hypothetical protein NKG94_05205 [Micromonospora sp. M12]
MTLGFFEEDRNGHRILGHGGDTGYFHSHLQIYPDDRAGIFLSLNSNGSGALDSHELRESVVNGFADRYFPAPQGSRPEVSTRRPPPGTRRWPPARTSPPERCGARSSRRPAWSVGPLSASPTVTGCGSSRDRCPTPRPVRGGGALGLARGGRAAHSRHAGDRRPGRGDQLRLRLHPAARRARPRLGVAVPVLALSTVVLLLALLSWPIGAIVRRRLGRAPRERAGRTARILSRLAAAGTLLALAGWVLSISSIMGLRDVPDAVLRTTQVLQLVGVLGVLPAAVRLVDEVRRHDGWQRVAGSALLLLALAGAGWFAVEFHLLAPSISY